MSSTEKSYTPPAFTFNQKAVVFAFVVSVVLVLAAVVRSYVPATPVPQAKNQTNGREGPLR